jgi:DNA-binding beta-propeller fold protein YncE
MGEGSDGVKRTRLGVSVITAVLGISAGVGALATAAGGARLGAVGPATRTLANGRRLAPLGRLTQLGNFPTGGALTRDGRFYWAVDSGHGRDDVQVVDIATGKIVEVLPLPGAYGGIAFSPDGSKAYVSGEPRGSSTPSGPTLADAGDAVHVFRVDSETGRGTEEAPIQLPPTTGGTAQGRPGTLGWPEGLRVTPDGRALLVTLNQADQIAIVDLTGAPPPIRLVRVGKFPYDVAASGDSRTAYVSNELDGTVSVVDIGAGLVTGTIGVGGARGDHEAHPEGLLVDPHRPLLYVAVTNRDLVAVIDITTRSVQRFVSVGRPEAIGTAPLALAESPDGDTLYVADSGEDAVAAISLTDRPKHGHVPFGAIRGLKAFQLIGRLPTAAYTSSVAVTPDGKRLVWLAAKGFGAGPNPEYGSPFANSEAAPYGSYVVDKLIGSLGVADRPNDRLARLLTARADRQVRPSNRRSAPPHTVVQSDDGGPSTQIEHVFYVVRENRTYDQIFGSDPRGDGDPALEVADDNGKPKPAGGVTPNAHALARRFPLLDHFYADSEVSTDGHVITSSSYAIDFVQKSLHADYSSRGRTNNAGQTPETFPPNYAVFDQAARQQVSFKNFGEFSGGLVNDGRPTFPAVNANQDFGYPSHFGCDGSPPNLACSTDSGHPGATGPPAQSRFDYFQQKFNAWVAGGADHVPSFVYLTLPNDHTNGASPGKPTPKALIADNDLGLGQLVQLISHSPVWHNSAIFVLEDDSQDGADHVDAHRMPAFVISPYAKKGVVHTRYDQNSALRTTELILGLGPLSLFDGLATPMYDAFTSSPDLTPYDAILPEQPLDERNPTTIAPVATATAAAVLPGLDPSRATTEKGRAAQALAATLPFDKLDLVPQQLADEVLWHSVYGWDSTPPRPGPGASPFEQARTTLALDTWRRGGDLAAALEGTGDEEAAPADS